MLAPQNALASLGWSGAHNQNQEKSHEVILTWHDLSSVHVLQRIIANAPCTPSVICAANSKQDPKQRRAPIFTATTPIFSRPFREELQ
jgi:hypothetical protein